MRRVLAAAMLLPCSLTACSARTTNGMAPHSETIVVSVPQSTQPWVAQFAARGAQLAAAEHPSGVSIQVEIKDNGGSAQQAVSIARQAVADHALAIITDGTGAKAVAAITDPANLPVFVVFDGDDGITDPMTLPTIFRIAPADKPMATRLADYMAASKPKVAIISDTTSFGRGGSAALVTAFARDHIPVTSNKAVDPSGNDLSGAITQARGSHATALTIWGSSAVVAAAVRAARSTGWQAPIFTGPTGEDPAVRQLLDDHASWLDGTKFVSFRITAEVGPKPFEEFRTKYEKKFGVDKVGVTADGRAVTMPPDWAMYGYDSVRLVAAAYKAAGAQTGPALMAAMQSTVITGANGDERGFGPDQREGVSPDDMYFGVFKDKRFEPVTDDILSTNLPSIPQG